MASSKLAVITKPDTEPPFGKLRVPNEIEGRPATVETDWARIEEGSASLYEMAEIEKITYEAACQRAARNYWVTMAYPSRKQEGKTETRVQISQLPRHLQKRLFRLRRRKQREAEGCLPHHGGQVVRNEDGRLVLTLQERLIVHGLYLKRSQPDAAHVFDQLVADCIRCRSGALVPVDRTFRGRYKMHKCANEECGFGISYATVRRIITYEIAEELKTAARHGVNAYVNKHGRYADLRHATSQMHRNQRIYGDHHECDILVWDPNNPRLAGGEPRVFRPWLSAWLDRATRVVSWRLGAPGKFGANPRPNAELLSLAFRAYILEWGVPEEVWSDNGKDYLSEQFTSLCESLGLDVHHTLPSKRTGESHAKSKPIERWFGTFERDEGRHLPGWTGSNAVEREERKDILWTLLQQHKEFLNSERNATPLLTQDQYEEKVRNWVEQSYLKVPHAELDLSPNEAFTRDSHAVRSIGNERVLDVLMMKAKTRVIGRNGVEVDGRTHWHERFFGLRGMRCTVRWDPANLGEVVVSVHQHGQADQVVIAQAAEYFNWSQEDVDRLQELKRTERRTLKAALEVRSRAAAGIQPRDVVLAEKAEREGRLQPAAVVNGIPEVGAAGIQEAHRIARVLDSKPASVSAPSAEPVDELYVFPAEELPEPDQPPVFDFEWEREEWERTHGKD